MNKKLKYAIWFVITQMMAGAICIYAVDKVLAMCDINIYVGINEFTMIISGIMGIPGVAVLFVLAGMFQM